MSILIKRPKVSVKWRKLLANIPNYDCFADAGDCWFDAKEAERWIKFFPTFLHFVEGERAGEIFDLDPAQSAIIANLFGWKRPDETRRYRECLIMVPRKNWKSTFCAGLAVAVLNLDDEPGMQVRSFASETTQASIVFKAARQMVLNDETLKDRIDVFARSMARKDDPLSTYSYVSADDKSKHGGNYHAAIVDELHVVERPLVDVIRRSLSARRQPLLIFITTSDYERPSICNEVYDYACKVRDGIVPDRAFLPVIYELTKADEERDGPLFWTMEKNWYKANPGLGTSKKLEYMQRECIRAQEMPSLQNDFLRFELDMRTQQAERWIDMGKWSDCSTRIHRVENSKKIYEETELQWRERKIIELGGFRPWAGFDLASILDMTALALLFKMGERQFTVIPYFWAPREKAEERERRDRVPYLTWANQGFLTLTDGDETDYGKVRADIVDICRLFPFQPGEETGQPEIAVDTLFQGAETGQGLGTLGFEVIRFGQNMLDFAAPTKEFEELVSYGLIDHGDNPILRWMAGNVCTYTDGAGNKKPSKSKSTEKIDGIVATIMALGRAIVKREKPKSVYETRGVRRF